MSQEYVVVKDEDGTPVGRIKVKTKSSVENFPAYVVNGSLLYGYAEYSYMQELASTLPDLEQE